MKYQRLKEIKENTQNILLSKNMEHTKASELIKNVHSGKNLLNHRLLKSSTRNNIRGPIHDALREINSQISMQHARKRSSDNYNSLLESIANKSDAVLFQNVKPRLKFNNKAISDNIKIATKLAYKARMVFSKENTLI